MGIEKRAFGTTADGREVDAYMLTGGPVSMEVITYGGIVTRLLAPDRDGKVADVVLGFDTLADYEADNPYFGAIIGRYGNRIAQARFTLNGTEYPLAANEPPHHLHGGDKGFDKVVWSADADEQTGRNVLRLTYVSPAGEEGYPGTLKVTVTYTLTDTGDWVIDYQADTDQPTPINLTQHSYFNLAGHAGPPVLDHELLLTADRFLPVDETLIPTGERRPVDGGPMDFTSTKPIGRDIDQTGGGYDHCYVLPGGASPEPVLAARALEPTSGRVLEMHTTEPAFQLYTGNFLDGHHVGKCSQAYAGRTGFCLEAQHFPDSPNQADFPSTILAPGETYRQMTIYRFTTD
jgi:aldose 1-epimerase